jgi:hypothetical protein
MQITAVATLPWSNDQLAASVHVQATGGPDAGVPTSSGEHRRSSHMATFRRLPLQDPSHNRLICSQRLAITPDRK